MLCQHELGPYKTYMRQLDLENCSSPFKNCSLSTKLPEIPSAWVNSRRC